ncbi:gamma-glutamyl-gamma-aminobutyrate hydrolase family protein [Emcibacter sp.]|uniref:gamma-glutamyl-gamma-aminobutyrate hydrolase family protein n=1 Tax=Emcibacter sp. TaxID=1979954 RepID=UPI003A90E120
MAKGEKPLIGYTGRDRFSFTQLLIALAIFLAGGRPLRLHPKRPHYHRAVQGLVIGGGTDLYPVIYEGLPKDNYAYDLDRDAMEIEWLCRAEMEGLPVLGICRGAQLMNVKRGGSLHVDVSKVYENARYPASLLANIFFRKPMRVLGDSLLSGLIGTGVERVNSMHRQAIDRVGEGLSVSAREDNGVVQAVEDGARDFYLGVQFHPEALIYRQKFRNLFKGLVAACGE